MKVEFNPCVNEDEIMEQHPGKQLFVDDFFIESMSGARRVLNRPQKITVDQPLHIPLELPRNSGGVQFQVVIYDEKNHRFRMYYRDFERDPPLLFALDSVDGMHWERPRLGLVELDGSKDNNATNCPPGHLAVLWDPHEEDGAFRWKRIDNKPTGVGPGVNLFGKRFTRAMGMTGIGMPTVRTARRK